MINLFKQIAWCKLYFRHLLIPRNDDSLFMPREAGDRPDVLPKGATNFAFLGQFAEAPKDCVFTVEYSVRTAQMAVYGLFETGKDVMPVYDSIHRPEVLIRAAQAISR